MQSWPSPVSPSSLSRCSAEPRSFAGLILVLLGALAAPAGAGMPPDYGPQPQLPAPDTSLLPTVKVATAVGWPKGEHPRPGKDLQVVAFAQYLDHPRWVYVLPNGDVLVAETNAPADRPEENKGIRGF